MRGRQGVLYNLSVLSLGQVISQLANLAALLILADQLGAHWFGVVQIGVAFMSYALITAEWGMMSLGIREVSRLDEPDAILRYARQHTGLLALQAALVFGLGLLILPRLPFYSHAPLVFLLYLASVLPQVYTQNWIAVGLERMSWVGASRIVRSLVYCGLILLLSFLDGKDGIQGAVWVPLSFLLAMLVSNLVVNFPVARWLGHFVHPHTVDWAEARRRWRETGTIGVNIIVLRLLFNIDILMLGSLAAPEVAGNYAAAARIIFLLVVAVEVLWAALLPRLSRLAKEPGPAFRRAFNLYFGLVAAILLPVAWGGFQLGDQIIAFVHRGQYPQAGPVFQVLAVSYSMLALATFLGNTLLSEDRQRLYSLPLLVASLVAVAGVRWLVPTHQEQGASWAMLAAHGVLLVCLLAINRDKLQRELGLFLLGLAPALLAMMAVLVFLPPVHLLFRIGAAVMVYGAAAALPARRFQARLRA
ncbi:hypothetical protein CSA17_04475 [bacterium DOLJORAL78_65_58]|nr:MAG: hypothetical protein CSB20_08175 [bacterium DOLZORAL124_64_63]PIE76007.1 MAG: hypothetical protein CSA17_04475 [bacterium DOLJORAL78_65_58]